MYKKAGIIVGILLVVVAIAIYLIVSHIQSRSDDPKDGLANTSSVVQVASTSSAAPKPPIQQSPVIQPDQSSTSANASTSSESAPAEMPSTPEPADTAGNMILLDVNKLPAYADVEDVGTVVGHNAYSFNGQVLFSLLINTTTNGQIEYFTTLTTYQLADNTRVNVKLRVYNSTSGSYPSIISISTAQ